MSKWEEVNTNREFIYNEPTDEELMTEQIIENILHDALDMDDEMEAISGVDEELTANLELNLNKDELWFLFNLAHSMDLSLNQCVNKILRDWLTENGWFEEDFGKNEV